MPELRLLQLFYCNTIEINKTAYIRKERQLKRSIFSYATINSTSLEIEFIHVTFVDITTIAAATKDITSSALDTIKVILPMSTKAYVMRKYILSSYTHND